MTLLLGTDTATGFPRGGSGDPIKAFPGYRWIGAQMAQSNGIQAPFAA